MAEEVKTIDLSTQPTTEGPSDSVEVVSVETKETTEEKQSSVTLEELQQQIQTLRAEKDAAQKTAEEAVAQKMTEAEKLEQERSAWRVEVETEREKLKLDLKNAALEKAGVLSKYFEFAPNIDVRTIDGQKALEKWISEHPEVVKQSTGVTKTPPVVHATKSSSRLADIMTGKVKSTLVTKKSLSEMYGSH